MQWSVLSAVALAVGTAVWAQAPGAPPAPAVDDIRSEPLADPGGSDAAPTEPVATRTRRPRSPTPIIASTATATATATATPADTETATAVPASATATRPPQSTSTITATATTVPLATRTASEPPASVPVAPGVDPRSQALTFGGGAALALLAAWFGARIAGARERGERRRARRTLATAMLLELRRIDAVLRRVVALDNPASFPSLDHPIMEAALRDLTLFQTTTAARIAQFHGALRGIQHEIGDYRDNPLRWAGRLGELNQLIKGRAAAACRAVPELMKALEQEGGTPPPHLPEPPPSAAADRSGLPPPPFGVGEGDDWTL